MARTRSSVAGSCCIGPAPRSSTSPMAFPVATSGNITSSAIPFLRSSATSAGSAAGVAVDEVGDHERIEAAAEVARHGQEALHAPCGPLRLVERAGALDGRAGRVGEDLHQAHVPRVELVEAEL